MTQQTLPGVVCVLVEYWENNSGGYYRVRDAAWRSLEAHGWELGRRKSARKAFPSLSCAIAEWELLTGLSAGDMGCNCCGRPHEFWEVSPE